FRTNNANAIRFVRQLIGGGAPVEICAAPESNPNQRTCSTIVNTGFGTQRVSTFYLNDTNDTGPHIVSLTVPAFGVFFMDAIEPVNTTAPLQAGVYEDNHPGIRYDTAYSENLVPDGDFEAETINYWSN